MTIVTLRASSPHAAPRLRAAKSNAIARPLIIEARGIQWICATIWPTAAPKDSMGAANQPTHSKESRVCNSHITVVTIS